MRVQFLRRASRQLQLQLEWWEENRPDAPNMMQVELRRMLKLLKSTPYMGVEARDVRTPGVRRVFLSTEHILYYRVNEKAGCVEVLRVWHMSRGRAPRR
jgi:plasmid stabilization system protein ParE